MRFWPSSRVLLLACVLFITGCKPQPAETVLHPIAIHTQSGVHLYTVEVARTPEEQQRGLMYRKTMPDNQGMLFLFPRPEALSFWMKNTYIPLDIIFIGPDEKVMTIHKMAEPLDETPLLSTGKAQYVLELNGGHADKIGLAEGDRIESDLLAP